MLSVRPKITELKFNVFARAVHPELFSAFASRQLVRTNYSLKMDITTAGHILRFDSGKETLTEICTGAHHPLPSQRLLISESIEKPVVRKTSIRDRIEYSSEFEFEGVNPKTFLTIQQQLDDKNKCEGLLHKFQTSGRIPFGAVSYINVQSFSRHVIVRCFHTFPDTCAVMKSETLIRVNTAEDAT